MIRASRALLPTTLLLALAVGCRPTPEAPGDPVSKSDAWIGRIGVSLAGGEFGHDASGFCNESPGEHGVDFQYSGPRTYTDLATHGVRVFRVPFRWERIQPVLRGPLDSEELDRLKRAAANARSNDAVILLDLHNYGAYRHRIGDEIAKGSLRGHGDVQDGEVSAEDLADCWRRLAMAFRDDEAVVAYAVMNEPHRMAGDSPDSWHAVSRTVVDAIREVDPNTCILLSGDRWAYAGKFEEVNGPDAWIDPRIENIVYEAHCYYDHDHSGKYALTYEEELSRDADLAQRGVERLRPFVEWLRRNNARGYIGEFGVPRDDPRWLALMEDGVAYLQSRDVGVCYWAAGEWWGDYPLSIQPNARGETAPQLLLLERMMLESPRGEVVSTDVSTP